MIFNPVSIGIGFVSGAFCPSILRKIKAFFVKEGNAAKADVSKVATQATTVVTKDVVSKL